MSPAQLRLSRPLYWGPPRGPERTARDEVKASTMETEATTTERRQVRIPSTGTRICLLLAALLLVVAAYFVLSPLMVTTASGSSWNCGTAMNPPSDQFGSGLCGQLNSSYLARGIAALAAAIVTGVGGLLLFGTVPRTEHQLPAPAENDGA